MSVCNMYKNLGSPADHALLQMPTVGFSCDICRAEADLGLLGHIVKVYPAAFRIRNHALGTKNDTVFLFVVKLRQDLFDLFL